MSIWMIGSLNVDLVVQVERFPQPGETLRGLSFSTYLGGKGGNQAMAVARLGGAPRVVGRVGNDDFGSRYRTAFLEAGATITEVRDAPEYPTGTALIEVDATGQNHIVVVAGANGTLDGESVIQDVAAIAANDIVLLQLEIPFEAVWAVAERAHAVGAVAILDPAPAAEIPTDVFPHLSWITPNEHEASIITGIDTSSADGLARACAALLEAGVQNAVVKAGARGAVYASRQSPRPQMIEGFPVQAVDTTAAGDSFNGGLAWALSIPHDPETAIRHANAVAALSVTGMGAQSAMPTADEVARFMSDKESK